MKYFCSICLMIFTFNAVAATYPDTVMFSLMSYLDKDDNYNLITDYTDTVDPSLWHNPSWVVESIDFETTENIAGDTVVIAFNFALNIDDKVVISVDDGANFAQSEYSLELALGGAGIGDVTYAVLQDTPIDNSTSLTFVMQESTITNNQTPLSQVRLLILSGASTPGQSVNFNLPPIVNNKGRDIHLSVAIYDSNDNLRAEIDAPRKLFETTLQKAPVSPLLW